MVEIPERVRTVIERNIDSIISQPKQSESLCRLCLKVQGIEPNLECILSYMLGMISGQAMMLFRLERKRDPNEDEFRDIFAILRRRVYEMRETILKTRIEE